MRAELEAAGSCQCQLTVGSVTESTIGLYYVSLPANRPKTYQNFFAVWDNTEVPWGAQPLKVQPVGMDSQMGSLVITDLAIMRKAYIVGYGVGTSLTTVCATAGVPVPGVPMAPTLSVSMDLVSVQSDSLVLRYDTLPGYLPRKFRNWVGLWQGRASPYDAPKPLAWAWVPDNASEGQLGLNDLPLKIGTSYTLVYFTGKERQNAAATLVFTALE